MVKGTTMRSRVHFLPITDIRYPVMRQDTTLPKLRMEASQLPASFPRSTPRTQLSPHSANAGKAGEVHERVRPVLNAPKVASESQQQVDACKNSCCLIVLPDTAARI